MKKYQLLLIACLSGVLLALSWPTRGFPGLIFLAWIPLLWVEDCIAKDKNRRFSKMAGGVYSFLPFLLFNIITTYWVLHIALPMVMGYLLEATVMAAAFQVYHTLKKKSGNKKTSSFLLVFVWMTYEYLQLHWELTFPWLNMGNVFSTKPDWVQWYEYTGSFGGSLWVLTTNIFGLWVVQEIIAYKTAPKKASLYCHIACFSLSIALPMIISHFVGRNYNVEQDRHADIVAIQPNLDPTNEQFRYPPEMVAYRMVKQAMLCVDEHTNFILSPESTLQETPWEDEREASYCLRILHSYISRYPHVEWLAGLSSRRKVSADAPGDAKRSYGNNDTLFYEYCNTALLIDREQNYPLIHKMKLTPFVEKMPYSSLFKPLEKFALDLGGIVGSLGVDLERKSIHSCSQNFNILPIICYESVYGEFVAEAVSHGADFIFIITNDGWWGNTQGYRQHCSYANLRAIETRRYVARSANTGISCFIDAKGNATQETTYWTPDAIKATLPIQTKITFYAKHGDYLAKIAIGITLIAIIFHLTQFLFRRFKKHP